MYAKSGRGGRVPRYNNKRVVKTDANAVRGWNDKDPDKHILLNNAFAGTPLDKYNVKRSFPTNSHRISLIKMRPYYNTYYIVLYELHF